MREEKEMAESMDRFSMRQAIDGAGSPYSIDKSQAYFFDKEQARVAGELIGRSRRHKKQGTLDPARKKDRDKDKTEEEREMAAEAERQYRRARQRVRGNERKESVGPRVGVAGITPAKLDAEEFLARRSRTSVHTPTIGNGGDGDGGGDAQDLDTATSTNDHLESYLLQLRTANAETKRKRLAEILAETA
jgi:hypothetical protein